MKVNPCGWVRALALSLLLAWVSPAVADLGWQEADYVKHYGAPGRAALTPDQLQFRLPPPSRLIVRFADRRSQEETWVLDGGAATVLPPTLQRQVEQARRQAPIQVVRFKQRGVAAAELFEHRGHGEVVQADVRGGTLVRVARCRERCLLLHQLLATEVQTDDLMARTEAELRRQSK